MRLTVCLVLLSLAGTGCLSIHRAVDPRILQETGAVDEYIEATSNAASGAARADAPSIPPSYVPPADAMAARRTELTLFLETGIVGEANTGYAIMRPDAEIPDPDLAQRAEVLVAVERVDRSKLFRKMAAAHWAVGLTPKLAGAYYAYQRLKRLPSGAWAQLPPQGPLYDDSLASELAKKLERTPAPNAWTQLP